MYVLLIFSEPIIIKTFKKYAIIMMNTLVHTNEIESIKNLVDTDGGYISYLPLSIRNFKLTITFSEFISSPDLHVHSFQFLFEGFCHWAWSGRSATSFILLTPSCLSSPFGTCFSNSSERRVAPVWQSQGTLNLKKK